MNSLIIPVYNKLSLTLRCLESVLENSTQLKEVFVIDNASKDETPLRLHEFKIRFEAKKIAFTIITNDANAGFGRACNQGVRLATGEFIAILNNDTWVMPGWDQVLAKVSTEKNLDLVGPFFDERPDNDDLPLRCKKYLETNSAKLRKHFVPILLFFRRSAVEKLKLAHGGIFDERFFVTFEDTDLLYRMREQHLRYAQTSLCYIWHHSMGTRSSPGLISANHELDGLRLFQEKWGFDPRPLEHTWLERLKRKYRKYRARRGLF